jgi:hypothetical protein
MWPSRSPVSIDEKKDPKLRCRMLSTLIPAFFRK